MAQYRILEIVRDNGTIVSNTLIEEAGSFENAMYQLFNGDVDQEEFKGFKVSGNVAVDLCEEFMYIITQLD